MDFYFYKHTLKYNLVLNELETLFTQNPMFITNGYLLTQEFNNYPNYVTSSYCDYLLNERLSNESMDADPMFITNGYLLTQEFNNHPNYVTSSYCDYLLNERLSNESMDADPVFVTAGNFNENLPSNCCNDLPTFVNSGYSSEESSNNYPIFAVENYNDIDDILNLNPNKNYYSNSYGNVSDDGKII
jgi:hypothetical protein